MSKKGKTDNSWANTKGGEEKKRWEDSVEKLDLTKDYQTIRYLESPRGGAKHWVDFKNADGQKKGFYSPCFSFNSDTQTYEDSEACPACKANIKSSLFYAAHAIVRQIQEDKPEVVKKEHADENGFKVKEKGWSPVRVVVVPSSVAKKIRNIITLNKYKIDGKVLTKTVEDPKFGCDLEISFDKDAEGTLMYDVQKGEKSALTEEELAYLRFDLSVIPNFLNSQETDATYYKEKADLERSLKQKGHLGGVDADEEDVPKRRRRSDDDEDEVKVASYDDEDEAPVKKKAKPAVVADDDEDEAPVVKKKAKPVVSDDDEDEAPVKKNAKPAVSDDDEDEAPQAKKAKPAVADDDEEEVAPKKKIKKIVEEDDEEVSASADDDDEDDAPVPAAIVNKKKKVQAEVEDEWD
jgi:hypothetical protein